jgi:hypothetical protein
MGASRTLLRSRLPCFSHWRRLITWQVCAWRICSGLNPASYGVVSASLQQAQSSSAWRSLLHNLYQRRSAEPADPPAVIPIMHHHFSTNISHQTDMILATTGNSRRPSPSQALPTGHRCAASAGSCTWLVAHGNSVGSNDGGAALGNSCMSIGPALLLLLALPPHTAHQILTRYVHEFNH